MYRRGGRYFEGEVVDIPGFTQLYASWEYICGVSQFDSKARREQKYQELYERYLALAECRDIIYQHEWYYLIVKDDKIQYENEDDDAWIDREFGFEDIEY